MGRKAVRRDGPHETERRGPERRRGKRDGAQKKEAFFAELCGSGVRAAMACGRRAGKNPEKFRAAEMADFMPQRGEAGTFGPAPGRGRPVLVAEKCRPFAPAS